MADPRPQPAAESRKAWFRRWWVWLIAALVLVGGISNLINPPGDGGPAETASPSQGATVDPSPVGTPAQLDLVAFLTDSNIVFESAQLSARKAVVRVPTETTNEEAAQIAEDVMLHICDHAAQTGASAPAANRVEVSDSVSIYSEGYDAAAHSSGFATDAICQD